MRRLIGSIVMRSLASVALFLLVPGCGGSGGGAVPVSLEVAPASKTLAAGTAAQLAATLIYSDGSREEVTVSADWGSSDTAIAAVGTGSGSPGRVTSASPGSAVITARYSGVSGQALITVTAATLSAIEVSPANPSLPAGMSRQFVATGIFSDNSKQDVTDLAAWSSGTPACATVGNTAGARGLATGVAAGATTITAAIGAVSGATTLTVTPATLARIDLTPAAATIPAGMTLQFVATGTFSDGTSQDLTASATWSSSNTSTATVGNTAGTKGLARGVAASATPVTVSAAIGGITGSTRLTVSSATLQRVEVTPAIPAVPAGLTLAFAATGVYSDGSTLDLTATATWGSSSHGVAIVSNTAGTNGMATAVAAGTTTISATVGAVSGTTTLTVTPATLATIDVTPTIPSVADGTTVQFTAMGTYTDNTTEDLTDLVTWSSSDDTIAVVGNAAGSSGLALATSPGTATIAATLNGISGNTTLTVTAATLVAIEVDPIDPTLPNGSKQNFTAVGIFSDDTVQDLTAQVTWDSSNTAVAAISNAAGSNGLATTLSQGSATITASLWGVSGSSLLTVTRATLASIILTPATPTVSLGTLQQFTAVGTYSDGSTRDLTKYVTWTSASPTVAVVSNAGGTTGLATPLKVGTATITAAMAGVVSSPAVMTVTAATLGSIAITPVNARIHLKTTLQYTATGNFSDGHTQDLTGQVTWSTSVKAVATVSNEPNTRGLATAVSVGTVTVYARMAGVTGNTSLTVSSSALVSISITPASPTIVDGATQQFTATGLYADSTTQDLTKQVTWASSKKSVAKISNGKGTRGVATANGTGTATITGGKSGISGNTVLTVI